MPDRVCHILEPEPNAQRVTLCGKPDDCPGEEVTLKYGERLSECPSCHRSVCPACMGEVMRREAIIKRAEQARRN